MSRLCSQCGTGNIATAKFCKNCGSNLSEEPGSFRNLMDTHNGRLRISDNHHAKWITLKEIGSLLELNDYELMKKAYTFELHITANISSINSRINTDTAQSFIEFILSNPS